jgi:hypothetical protein
LPSCGKIGLVVGATGLDRARLGLATLVAAAAATLAGQQPSFRAGIESVRLDVHVVDAQGRFVPDLTKDDFTVAALQADINASGSVLHHFEVANFSKNDLSMSNLLLPSASANGVSTGGPSTRWQRQLK